MAKKKYRIYYVAVYQNMDTAQDRFKDMHVCQMGPGSYLVASPLPLKKFTRKLIDNSLCPYAAGIRFVGCIGKFDYSKDDDAHGTMNYGLPIDTYALPLLASQDRLPEEPIQEYMEMDKFMKAVADDMDPSPWHSCNLTVSGPMGTASKTIDLGLSSITKFKK